MPQFGGPEWVLKSMKKKEKTALNERRPRPDRRYPARSHHLIGKILPIQIAGMWGGMGGNLTHQVTGSFRPRADKGEALNEDRYRLQADAQRHG